MLRLHTSLDSVESRTGNPRVIRLAVRTDRNYLTFGTDGTWESRYVVIGTNYGYLHDTAGSIRLWRSESAARRACRAYVGI